MQPHHNIVSACIADIRQFFGVMTSLSHPTDGESDAPFDILISSSNNAYYYTFDECQTLVSKLCVFLMMGNQNYFLPVAQLLFLKRCTKMFNARCKCDTQSLLPDFLVLCMHF